MLQKPILSGRLGKWAYALTEYDLGYMPLKAMKGQVIADFIVDHSVGMEEVLCVNNAKTWFMSFDGSMCNQVQGIGCFIRSTHAMEHELSIRLEFECTNNQAEYKALISGLEVLASMGVKEVETFGDLKLVVQQINEESQCLDGVWNGYREKCMDMLKMMDKFSMSHVSQEDNVRANMLAQQASGYDVWRGKFDVKREPTSCDVLVTDQSNGDLGHGGRAMMSDWRHALIECINNPSHTRDIKVRRQALKYTLVNGELYWRTIEGVLLRCLSEEESKVVMGEVHKGLCDSH
jgi:ribonuclease HI